MAHSCVPARPRHPVTLDGGIKAHGNGVVPFELDGNVSALAVTGGFGAGDSARSR